MQRCTRCARACAKQHAAQAAVHLEEPAQDEQHRELLWAGAGGRARWRISAQRRYCCSMRAPGAAPLRAARCPARPRRALKSMLWLPSTSAALNICCSVSAGSCSCTACALAAKSASASPLPGLAPAACAASNTLRQLLITSRTLRDERQRARARKEQRQRCGQGFALRGSPSRAAAHRGQAQQDLVQALDLALARGAVALRRASAVGSSAITASFAGVAAGAGQAPASGAARRRHALAQPPTAAPRSCRPAAGGPPPSAWTRRTPWRALARRPAQAAACVARARAQLAAPALLRTRREAGAACGEERRKGWRA
jgi:hypothetical protein